MKKFQWKIILVFLILLLLIPYAGTAGQFKVQADETSQESSSEQTTSSSAEESQSSESENSNQAPVEVTSGLQSVSLNGTLSDMIDQLHPPTPIISESDSNSFANDEGITIDGKFYSNAELDVLLERMTLAPNAPDFTIDVNGQIQFNYDLRIFPLAAPIFVALLPIIGKVFVSGVTIIVAGVMIHENDKQYNKVVSRLNAAQKAKVAAEKAKVPTKPGTPKNKTKDSEDEMTADQIISKRRKASVRREFPKEYLNKKWKDIKNAADKGNAIARKARKLLQDGRFKK